MTGPSPGSPRRCTHPLGHINDDGVYLHRDDFSFCDVLNQPVESP